jgi:hypothetical protein
MDGRKEDEHESCWNVMLIRPRETSFQKCLLLSSCSDKTRDRTAVVWYSRNRSNNSTMLADKRQAMYVQSNIEARSCNHCCIGKAIRNIYIYIYIVCFFFYIYYVYRAASWYYQSFLLFTNLMHNWIVLKTILKFTLKLILKQLLHVSVQSPSSVSFRSVQHTYINKDLLIYAATSPPN